MKHIAIFILLLPITAKADIYWNTYVGVANYKVGSNSAFTSPIVKPAVSAGLGVSYVHKWLELGTSLRVSFLKGRVAYKYDYVDPDNEYLEGRTFDIKTETFTFLEAYANYRKKISNVFSAKGGLALGAVAGGYNRTMTSQHVYGAQLGVEAKLNRTSSIALLQSWRRFSGSFKARQRVITPNIQATTIVPTGVMMQQFSTEVVLSLAL